MKSKGMVYLVGAGPGDLGLTTLRAVELLKRADVVVFDALINQELLRFAPKEAEFIYGGKRSRNHAIPQEELNSLLISKAQEGKTVVRLKGGDPYIFGRGGEEAEELQAAGVGFEVVPGVTSISAAANYAGIPLTHRDHCSSFTVVTGHESSDKGEIGVDWERFAREPGTKIILMGVERIQQISAELIKNGVPASTPVAMIRWGTTGRQSSIEGTLATIAEVVVKTGFKPPAVTIVGDVVQLRSKLNWFEQRPLFGKRIVVTRTREQASELTSRLREKGADVMEIPTIKIVAPDNKMLLAEALVSLGEYDWLVFTSPNGVTTFFEHFFKAFEDVRALGNVRIAAVGPSTAAKVKELHLRVDAIPDEYVASKVATAISAFESVENLRIALMRAEVANPELPKELEELGAIVDDVPCYKTIPEAEDLTGAAGRLAEEGADYITFTSSSTVEHFNARSNLKELKVKFPELKLVSIGPETTKTLRKLGLTANIEAQKHSIEGMLAAIEADVAALG
jgi:uroporphyrinogen III methyltransferase / synthase